MNPNAPASDDTLLELGRYMAEIDRMLASTDLPQRIGPGLERELRYALTTFRQRFPDALPGAQPSLL